MVTLENLLFKFGIVHLAEHLLNLDKSLMLEVSSDHKFFIRPVKTTTGCPSGALIVVGNKKFKCSCLES